MLRMTPSVSAEAAKSYFREALSRGEYYTNQIGVEQEIVGHWGGKAAEKLGLKGEVDQLAFERLCDNCHPATGEKLTVRNQPNRRPGYDFNFHVPKSVSAVMELTGDDRILATLRSAVADTMREIERGVQTRVRTRGRNENRLTGNMVWAEFVHFTARPVDGVPDPHLHLHAFIPNATWDPAERRWKAIELGDVKRDAPYYQAAYHARLAERLTALGYYIERRGEGWEIAGIPESIVKKFSRRTEEIERAANEQGIVDPNRKSKLGAKTRNRKSGEMTMEKLREGWRERIDAEESTALKAARANARGQRPVRLNTEKALDASLDHAQHHLFEQNSIIPEKRLLAAALEIGVSQITPEAVWTRFRHRVATKDILRRTMDGQSWVTTPAVLAEEQKMLMTIREGRGKHMPIKHSHQIHDQQLAQDQREAVKHVLESTDSVILIRGRAGVGKTRTMKEVVKAIESTGRRVQVAAPSAMATHEVLREDGFENAQTVAHVLSNPQTQHRLKGNALWVDEAGLLSVPDMQRLVRIAERTGTRLILSGDTSQHRSVIRGDAMKLIEKESGLKPIELKQVRRQKTSEYKRAVETVARGDLGKGFEQLDKMGSIREVGDHDRGWEVARAYTDSTRRGRSALVVSPTHAEGREVTNAIRGALRAEGRLATTDQVVPQLKPLHLSVAKRKDPAMYTVGNVIQFHRHAGFGFKASDRAEVVGHTKRGVMVKRQRDSAVTRLPVEAAERYQVYEQGTLPVTAGDRIRITANGYTDGRKHQLRNGAMYTVAGFDKRGRMTLGDGWALPRDFGHVAHGYCVTSDASQGRTVDHVILAQSEVSAPAGSVQQFYTSVTRGRHEVTVFTDDKDRLLKSIGKDASRTSATEMMQSGVEPPRVRGEACREALGHWLNHKESGRRATEQSRHRSEPSQKQERGRDRGRDLDLGGLERER